MLNHLGRSGWVMGWAIGAIALSQGWAGAQVIPDRTLGNESSKITPLDQLRDRIDGGAMRGANLFHSFQEFNVGEGKGVYFSNPAGIENILSRVTGSNASQILGRLGVLGGANLFLLNPNGIIFGAKASLDIQGSFFATTAEGIKLGDQGFFSATEPGKSTLLAVSPGALFFNQVAHQAGNIINQGNLAVGKDLTLAAGNLDLQGQLLAGGNLTLQAIENLKIRDTLQNPFIATAKGNLWVQGNQTVDIFALNRPESGLFSGGNMVLRSANTVGGDAHFWSGGNFRIEKLDGSLGDLSSPHDPVIRANGDVVFNDYTGASLHILAGGRVYIPGTITITGVDDAANSLTETVTLSDSTTLAIAGSAEPTVDIRAGTTAFGSPFVDTEVPTRVDIILGNITFNASLGSGGKVFISNQYHPNSALGTLLDNIQVGAIKTGDLLGGGSVTIDSRKGIQLNDTVDVSADSSLGAFFGNGGNVKLLAQNNILTGASILARGEIGGNITLSTPADISIVKGAIVDIQGGGGGNITVSAHNLELREESQLKAGIAEGLGSPGARGGDIVIQTPGTTDLTEGSVISNGVNLQALGNAGKIELTTGSLSVREGALINTSTFGEGDAGVIKIVASDKVSFDGGLAISAVFPTGKGKVGGIEITALHLEILNSSEINTSTFGQGDTGGIEITTGSLAVRNQSVVTTSVVGSGNGGTLKINANDKVTFDNSNIFNALDKDAIGEIGGIEITADSLEILNGSNLSTATLGQGNGGSLKLNTQKIVVDGSLVSSSVGPEGQGNAGGIEIKTPVLEVLSSGQLDASTLGVGNAGTVKITATEKVKLDGGLISSVVGQTGRGNAGGIEITTPLLEIVNEGQLNTSTLGQGNAGTIKIAATDKVTLDNSFVFNSVALTGQGNAGGIEINTPLLEVLNEGQVNASTFGKGNAGIIKITATNKVTLNGGSISSQVAAKTAQGNAGGVEMTTPVLEVRNDAILDASTLGEGNAGTVKIKASDRVIFDNGFAGSTVAKTGKGNAGGIEITTPILEVRNGSELNANTFGQGNAGNVKITATDKVTFDGGSVASQVVEETAQGNAGGIEITTPVLEVLRGGQLDSSTFGQGNAGTLKITATQKARFDGGFTASEVGETGKGKAGGIEIITPTLEVVGGGGIGASSLGQGEAGDIRIQARDQVTIVGAPNSEITPSGIFAFTTNSGKAGTIAIDTQRFTLSDGAQVAAFTSGEGNAGDILITAPQFFSLGANSKLTVETAGKGKAGDIVIDSDTITIGENAKLSATATATATNLQEGGSITLKTNNLNISGNLGIFAETQGQSPAGNLTLQPNSNHASLNIRLTNQGLISASTSGSGQGGSINLSAPQSIDIRGQGKIAVGTFGTGNAGKINITTQNLNLAEGLEISASTTDKGNAGNIKINADQIHLSQTQLTASTSGSGNAGNIAIYAKTVNLDNSAITTIVSSGASGQGGNITLETIGNSINLRDRSQISSRSQGSGNAGNIIMSSQGNLTLSDSNITTNADQASGGAITITAQNIRLIGNSDIRTNVNSGNGGGGDITLNANSILLFDDSDILAFARDGKGGNITFQTPVFFAEGFQGLLTSLEVERLNGNARADINASGAIFGTITLPDLSFIRNSLVELPENIINTDQLIANSCVVSNRKQAGTFILTGAGGLPTRPDDASVSPYPTGEVRAIPTEQETSQKPWQLGDRITEPQGFYSLPNGKLVLSRECSR